MTKDDILMIEIVEYCIAKQDELSADMSVVRQILQDIIKICASRSRDAPPN